jgi:hypothetical protein
MSTPKELPIFRLLHSESEFETSIGLAQSLFGIKENFEFSRSGTNPVLKSSHFSVESTNEGLDVWATDQSQFCNPELRPKLLNVKETLGEAEKIIAKKKLLPKLGKQFSFAKPQVGGTYYSMVENEKRQDHLLDRQIVYPIQVNDLPVVGGRGDYTLAFGDKGNLISFSGGGIQSGESFQAKVIEKERVEKIFKELTSKLPIVSHETYLAYHAGATFDKQEYLYPVYVIKSKAKIGKELIHLRNIIIPATEFGPTPPRQVPQKIRNGRTGLLKEISEASKVRRTYASRAASNPFEAGASWIGLSGGLTGSQANAQGFIDGWRTAGWRINFNWGDANAWESDWRRNDDTWVDAADFVFYTGHANMNGWVLANPDDGFLSFTEVGSSPGNPGDLWGQNDLEWAVIAACGPLQDNVLYSGGGSALDRWKGAFDGMHLLMGYGGVTFDNTTEGAKLAQYAKQGQTLINAWFRTAKEVQPSTNGYGAPDGPNIYVGALWASKAGANPYNDHAWGYGSVSADPKNPTVRHGMWSLC